MVGSSRGEWVSRIFKSTSLRKASVRSARPPGQPAGAKVEESPEVQDQAEEGGRREGGQEEQRHRSHDEQRGIALREGRRRHPGGLGEDRREPQQRGAQVAVDQPERGGEEEAREQRVREEQRARRTAEVRELRRLSRPAAQPPGLPAEIL